jgi:ribosomal protein L12E/L44/L45/RPP1/RPP2
MKTVKWLLIIALLFSLFLISTCKKEGDEVAVKIDDEKITINQFNNYYYMFARMMLNLEKKDADKMAANPEIETHPTLNLLNKSKFMEFFVSRKLLYIKAFQDESINKDDLKTVTELAKLQFISSYYLSQKLKDEIKVSDDDVNKFYAKNKDKLKGVPMNDEAINWMKQQIFMEKLELRSNQFILEILGEIKVNKDGFKKYMAKLQKEKAEKDKEKDKNENKEEKKEEKKNQPVLKK